MTQAEWHISGDPEAMLRILRGCAVASERKLRLYACTCAELAIAQLPNRADYQRLLETAEQMAEGLAQFEEVRNAWQEGIALEIASTRSNARIASAVTCTTEREAYRGACGVVADLLRYEQEALGRAQPQLYAHLLRCIFGNPYRGLNVGFRPVTLDPAWRTSDVVALARGIYEDRAFDRIYSQMRCKTRAATTTTC